MYLRNPSLPGPLALKMPLKSNNYTVNTYYLHRQRGIEIGDEDRIGVPEAFRGLYSQITSLISRLQGVSFEGTVSSYAGRSALNELTSCQTTLRELKRALAEADLSLERASLIQAQHLIISPTDGILILDSLQSALTTEVIRGRSEHQGQATVMHLLRRLQAQGLIWKTQLRILVCEHDLDAHKESLTLDEQVAKVLGDNQNLQDRLTAMEDRLNELSEGASIRLPVSMPPKSRAVSIVSREPAKTARSVNSKARTFERILAKTKVYRRNEQRSEVFSMQSSAGRSYAWSEFSISDASTLSVIALPIKISELASGELYRSKRPMAAVDIDLEMDHQSLMEDSDNSDSESRPHRGKHLEPIRPRDHIEQALLEQSRMD
ncbi:hypothetical protein HII31_03345 [Pseudocercospora fuligena]|uniref:Uncharacterized protein n=1 Tax=Pseudocercospora fuligena TaxID=685502 RepID=A0A8H6RQF3_9PEZI|nr:hypothetical protein HII31_03345 [Pseudocercospora fuligena]